MKPQREPPAWPKAARRGIFWLASYPKSGNTWLRAALASLRSGGGEVDINALGADGDTIASSRLHFDRLVDADSSDLVADEILNARPYVFRQIARQQNGPVLWKAHEARIVLGDGQALFPPEASAGAAYIVRDPRDVAVSLAHHLQCAIDQAIAMMADPAAQFGHRLDRLNSQLSQPLSSWSGHVRSWIGEGGPVHGPPAYAIRYEDMLDDLSPILNRLSNDLGWNSSSESIAGAVEATRFQRLQCQEQSRGFREKPVRMPEFFRQGRAAAWRETLSTAQASRIERDHGEVMRALGYL